MNDCTREVMAIEIDTSLSDKRVIRVLEKVTEERRKPLNIRVDNKPKFTANEFVLWCKDKETMIHYIQPGNWCNIDLLKASIVCMEISLSENT